MINIMDHSLIIPILVFTFIWLIPISVIWLLRRFDHIREQQLLRERNDREEKYNIAYDASVERIRELAQVHMKTLLIKRAQLIIKDDYGTPDTSRWDKELAYYIKTVVLPNMNYDSVSFGDDEREEIENIAKIIDEYVVSASKEKDSQTSQIYNESMSPFEYEYYCADLFKEKGWDAKVTKASGDQGIDIVAQKEQTTIAVQCKKYAKPVGNRAVQEIRTGVEFIGADYGIVVAPMGFTRSAKELAGKTGVRLMHHSEIQDFVQMI